jgi:hypothetical protein
MSPFQHGEVFVTDDGAETDLDLGHYERFLTGNMSKANNFTAGQVYETVIKQCYRTNLMLPNPPTARCVAPMRIIVAIDGCTEISAEPRECQIVTRLRSLSSARSRSIALFVSSKFE